MTDAWKTEERYRLAAEITSLVEKLQRFAWGTTGFGGVNWNYAIVRGLTDSLENLILKDVLMLRDGSSLSSEKIGEIRSRISRFLSSRREIVAELELSGLRYDEKA